MPQQLQLPKAYVLHSNGQISFVSSGYLVLVAVLRRVNPVDDCPANLIWPTINCKRTHNISALASVVDLARSTCVWGGDFCSLLERKDSISAWKVSGADPHSP